jgi:hypothetical protein
MKTLKLISPSKFASMTSLLAEGGPVSAMLSPTPSGRSLARTLRAAGIPSWKSKSRGEVGRSEIYFDRSAVEVWLNSKVVRGVAISSGVNE